MELSDLKSLCLEMNLIREKIKHLDEQKKSYNEKLTELKLQAVETLDQQEIGSFDFGDGKISITEKRSVKMLDKFVFFDWLKERGTFEDIVSINSQTLNKIYRDEFALAQESGDVEFLANGIPGLSEPNTFRDIRFYK